MNENALTKQLMAWYAQNGRNLPWRHKGGAHPDPYVVLVSEIMLQQTTVKTVLSYFERFMYRFPTLQSLAEAPIEEVYLYWQGLGYYARARSLHAAAKAVFYDYQGRFPDDKAEASKLKGLGAYTLASYLALAFNKPETVVDGNVIRVISRLYHFTKPVEDMMPEIRKCAEALTDVRHPADYASAIMDLGACVCTPKNPKCDQCPWQESCLSKNLPDVEQIPQKSKIGKKKFEGYVYLISDGKGAVYIRKRVEKGLLSGLYEFPWSEKPIFQKAQDTGFEVSHIFTHIDMRLKIMVLCQQNIKLDGTFVPVADLKNFAFSTLMRKVWQKGRETFINQI